MAYPTEPNPYWNKREKKNKRFDVMLGAEPSDGTELLPKLRDYKSNERTSKNEKTFTLEIENKAIEISKGIQISCYFAYNLSI